MASQIASKLCYFGFSIINGFKIAQFGNRSPKTLANLRLAKTRNRVKFGIYANSQLKSRARVKITRCDIW